MRPAPIPVLLLAALTGCAADTFGAGAGRGDLVLAPLRPLLRVYAGEEAPLSVIVLRQGDQEGQAAGEPGERVSFRLIGVSGAVALATEQAVTDAGGVAVSSLRTRADAATSPSEPTLYQVEASLAGVEPVALTVEVYLAGRTLRRVTADPVAACTQSRVTLVAEAFSLDRRNPQAAVERPLGGEPITFRVMQGPGRLDDPAGGAAAADCAAPSCARVRTAPNGRAQARLTTGDPIGATIVVSAEMPGTAPTTFSVLLERPGPCADRGGGAPPPPAGPLCDPIKGGGCPDGRRCIAGRCEAPPGACAGPRDCPNGFSCERGTCRPFRPGGGSSCAGGRACPMGEECVGGVCTPPACAGPEDCPGEACVGGECVPAGECAPPPAGRLAGTWDFRSTLHLDEALNPVFAALIQVGDVLEDVLNGGLDIPGLPGFVSDLVEDLLRDALDDVIPPWGRELIGVLDTLGVIINDWTVDSTVVLASAGGSEYTARETWDLIRLEDDAGMPMVLAPDDLPGVGAIAVDGYNAREICGVYFADRHDVSANIGEIVAALIDMTVSGITCNIDGVPCADGLADAIDLAIDCGAIAGAIADIVYDLAEVDVYDPVESACEAGKTRLVREIEAAIASLEADVISLEGLGTVAGAESIVDGVWSGELLGGSFPGEFRGNRAF